MVADREFSALNNEHLNPHTYKYCCIKSEVLY
jgi:hypothetical protein